jgi:hypothetical protein
MKEKMICPFCYEDVVLREDGSGHSCPLLDNSGLSPETFRELARQMALEEPVEARTIYVSAYRKGAHGLMMLNLPGHYREPHVYAEFAAAVLGALDSDRFFSVTAGTWVRSPVLGNRLLWACRFWGREVFGLRGARVNVDVKLAEIKARVRSEAGRQGLRVRVG